MANVVAAFMPERPGPGRPVAPVRPQLGVCVVEVNSQFESYETYEHAAAPTSNNAGVMITEWKQGRISQVVIHAPGTFKTISWTPGR